MALKPPSAPASVPASASSPKPRYAVWNNKGGVGKTFVTFVVAVEYAHQHPDVTVVVVDMCPQCNVSEILLGGNSSGATALTQLLAKSPRQTIGGYFDQRVRSPHSKTGTELSFLVDPRVYNPELPPNVRMVAGDPSLEVQAQAINQIAAQTLPADAWANVHRWAFDLVDAIQTQVPNAVFFLDCNPSFAAYTELALIAATRIIVPCTADGSSARAIDNIGQLLYGIGVPAQYQNASFSAQANRYGLPLPSIHLVPLNRSTQYDRRASKAFEAMYHQIQQRVDGLRKLAPTRFSIGTPGDEFFDIPDAHSVSVVCSHKGLPLYALRPGPYEVYDLTIQVNPEPLDRYYSSVKQMVSLL
jgi:cellulose biosynthesis protein BcsQ